MDETLQNDPLFEMETLSDWQEDVAIGDPLAAGAACNSNNSNNDN
jgi:hypothetical protein